MTGSWSTARSPASWVSRSIPSAPTYDAPGLPCGRGWRRTMPDRLDDLLHQLPMETMSADLPARIQLRLQADRSMQRRVQLGLDAVLAVLVICGLLVLGPSMAGAAGWLTGGSVGGSMGWVSRLGGAPAPGGWPDPR